MAPTSEDLHELVAKLESRVKDLEQKLFESHGGAPKPAVDSEGVRMILMGPPGAGMCALCHCSSAV
jgi:adenylate kinase